MNLAPYLKKGSLGALALVLAGAQFVPGTEGQGPVLLRAATLVGGRETPSAPRTTNELALKASEAVHAFAQAVRPLSHPKALDIAFRSYFAYKSAHPYEVKKPLLYFVDYGLPSTEPRGYVFDMSSLSIVEGPFTVAHGRGSSHTQFGVPTWFSNAFGSAATSLGLYVGENLYDFYGHSGGSLYHSIGLRLKGVSSSNDNALARGVVAHGAPYVTPTKAGRSEGCPAMEQDRARRLLPELADGGMIFLFAPDANWMSTDPWASAE